MNTNVTRKAVASTERIFGIDAVLSVVTGVLMAEKGFNAVHEIMDLFFPGVMTLGTAAMLPEAQDYIFKKYPFLKDLPPVGSDNWEGWLAERKKELPLQLTLAGPLDVPESVINKRFEEMLSRSGK